MADVIMKSTVVGSKWVSFDAGSELDNYIFPTSNSRACIKNQMSCPRYVDITVLQVMVTPYGNKLRYTVEYIEC